MRHKNVWQTGLVLGALVAIWEGVSFLKLVPEFMLPSFSSVIRALVSDFPLLMMHLETTLQEAFLGLIISLLLGLIVAFAMDLSSLLRQILYPLIVLSQTLPTIALAPLLTLWFGYGILPKILLVVLVGFFPITMSIFKGLQTIDKDQVNLFLTFNASSWQMVRYLKFPSILPDFFAGLKVSASYAVIAAVVSEWLGGDSGLGVYMTRARRSFSFDKMFAVILLTSFFSLVLVALIALMENRVLVYRRKKMINGKEEKE